MARAAQSVIAVVNCGPKNQRNGGHRRTLQAGAIELAVAEGAREAAVLAAEIGRRHFVGRERDRAHRIALIHAGPVSVEPVIKAFAEIWPKRSAPISPTIRS